MEKTFFDTETIDTGRRDHKNNPILIKKKWQYWVEDGYIQAIKRIK